MALCAPIARLLGLKVVFTHHGPDYDRDKWGGFAKFMLRLGEWCRCKFANEVIVISDVIKDLIARKHGRVKGVHLIYNGVPSPELCHEPEYFRELGIEEGKYILGMCRFVPEKHLHDLVSAYLKVRENWYKEWLEAKAQGTASAEKWLEAKAQGTASAKKWLEANTMSNRGQRPRNGADAPNNCLEGSTFEPKGPEDYPVKLVLAGDTDFEDDYSRGLKQMARDNGVVLTGFVRGKKLHSLLTNAMCYSLPSSHEGLPIALLEAMSYQLPVITSAIPANLEVGLDADRYHEVGDVDALAQKLSDICSKPLERVKYDMGKYDWDRIAKQVSEVYEGL